MTHGKIAFDRVQFKYKKGQNLFVDKSVTIPGGAKVGLVGLSGSGKTTFVNLLLRFYDIDSGKITIDGQNIKEVSQESLRSQIAIIPQDPVLFHRSLMENIRYGRLDATDEEVISCAKKAHCHDFIQNLRDGYDSLVGERGVKLSGGQRQCIAIARALLKNAPILIFDEATSSLDSVTESYIQKSLPSLMEDKTTIMIAHRLSTLQYVDRILVFNEGKIVEDGAHSQLIALNGHFKTLWSMQAIPKRVQESDFIEADASNLKQRSGVFAPMHFASGDADGFKVEDVGDEKTRFLNQFRYNRFELLGV